MERRRERWSVYACVCVCVCEGGNEEKNREREGDVREGEREKKRGKEREKCVEGTVVVVLICAFPEKISIYHAHFDKHIELQISLLTLMLLLPVVCLSKIYSESLELN